MPISDLVEQHTNGHWREQQPLSLVLCSPDQVHDSDFEPCYEPVNAAAQWAWSADGPDAIARCDSADGRVGVTVRYSGESDGMMLRKHVAIQAVRETVYVAGATLWDLAHGPALAHVWPRHPAADIDAGQPVVFLNDELAWIISLEWSLSLGHVTGGGLQMEYRSGYWLEPGQSVTLCAASLQRVNVRSSPVAPLDQARQAFYAALTQRLQPPEKRQIKATTWGPWMWHFDERHLLDIIEPLAGLGTELFHVDAGWQQPDRPYSKHMPAVRDADDEAWDKAMTNALRLPRGLRPVLEAVRKHGMKLSLWFDAAGTVFIRETEAWASRRADGSAIHLSGAWEAMWRSTPFLDMQSPYAQALRTFIEQMQRRYDLGGVMFDNQSYGPPDATGRWPSLACGWNQTHVSRRLITELLDEAEARSPGIYRFLAHLHPRQSPWMLLHSTHVHAGDPARTDEFTHLLNSDFTPRSLAAERRVAWRQMLDRFIPPWGIKGDIAGWAFQQNAPIALNRDHARLVPGFGEGWTQNMFTCFATTPVRDIRFDYRVMPAFDYELLRKWLAWGQKRAGFARHARPWWRSGADATWSVEAIAQIDRGRGLLFVFNPRTDPQRVSLPVDERGGFNPGDADIPLHAVYPVTALLPQATISYGQTLELTVPSRDCLVIECALDDSPAPQPHDELARMVNSVRRSYDPVELTNWSTLIDTLSDHRVEVELPADVQDRAVCEPIAEALAAWCAPLGDDAPRCRVLLGSFEGLRAHPVLGERFVERYESRLIAWDDSLYAAPLLARLDDGPAPAFALLGARPEHLLRLAQTLSRKLLERCDEVQTVPGAVFPFSKMGGSHRSVTWSHSYTFDLPERASMLLRFMPEMEVKPAPTPMNLSMIRYRITARIDHDRRTLWEMTVPPFVGAPWWGERLLALDALAGRRIRLDFEAAHVHDDPCATVQAGINEVALFRRMPR